MKTLRITPHGVTKFSPFEAHMGGEPNTPLSNIATNSSPKNLNWESAKHACLYRKNLTKPPLPTEVMHDLERWSEDEIHIRKKGSPPKVTHKPLPRTLTNRHSPTQPETGGYSKPIELAKNKFYIRYKAVQRTVDKNIEKRIGQVARKTIWLATKVKNPNKKSRLLRNSGTAFAPNPVIYGPCRSSRLSDYVDYKSARRTRRCLLF